MPHDPTLSAFLRLRSFTADVSASPLDRLATGNAAAWLAHASSYGLTAEKGLLTEIADPGKHPVERAKSLACFLVNAVAAGGLPTAPPFQSVDVLYSSIVDTDDGEVDWQPQNPFENALQRGPLP